MAKHCSKNFFNIRPQKNVNNDYVTTWKTQLWVQTSNNFICLWILPPLTTSNYVIVRWVCKLGQSNIFHCSIFLRPWTKFKIALITNVHGWNCLKIALFALFNRSTVNILGQWALSTCSLLCWTGLNWLLDHLARETRFLPRTASKKSNLPKQKSS